MTMLHTLPAGQVSAPLRFTVALTMRSLNAGELVIVSVVGALPLASVEALGALRVAGVFVGFLVRLKVTVAPFTLLPAVLTLAVITELSLGGVSLVLVADRVSVVRLLLVLKPQA